MEPMGIDSLSERELRVWSLPALQPKFTVREGNTGDRSLKMRCFLLRDLGWEGVLRQLGRIGYTG